MKSGTVEKTCPKKEKKKKTIGWHKGFCLIGVITWLFLIIPGAMAMTDAERDKILMYATLWAYNYNPEYKNYANDPNANEDANFVSQAVMAGGYMFSNDNIAFMDKHGCMVDRGTLEWEVRFYLNTDRYVINALGDLPANIASGDVIFFMSPDERPQVAGIVLVAEPKSETTMPLPELTVAYHDDSNNGAIGDIKYLSEILFIYEKAVLYHFRDE